MILFKNYIHITLLLTSLSGLFVVQCSAQIILTESSVMLQNVSIGSKIDISASLPQIKNKSKAQQVCNVSLQKPNKLKRGYKAIPDKNWFLPAEKKIILKPKGNVRLKDIYLKIPDEAKYYNQHYQAVFKVRTEKAISVEIAIPVWIETETTDYIEKNPWISQKGSYGFMPTVIDLSVKSDESAVLHLCNNTDKQQSFTIFAILPPKRSASNVMPQSPGYKWLENEESLEINIEEEKKISHNRYEVQLKPKEIVPVNVKLAGKKLSKLKKREAFIVAVPKGMNEWKISRVRIIK